MKGRHLMPETRVKQVGEAAVTGEDGVTFCPPPEHLAAFTPDYRALCRVCPEADLAGTVVPREVLDRQPGPNDVPLFGEA